MLRIAILGGSGFIGTRLVSRLIKNGYSSLAIIDKAPSILHPDLVTISDVRDFEVLRNAIPDKAVIVHLAAEHRDDVHPHSLYDDVNVGGAANICEVARYRGVSTVIFTSTVAVYGFAPIGTDESGRIAPFNDYGRTKYEAEQLFKSWQAELPTQRTLVIIRPTVVFGEKNRGNVYNLIRQIANKRFVMVGRGENRKSMAYVENIAAFIEYCISFQPGVYVYNYTDKPDFTMNKLVATVNYILGQSNNINFRIPYGFGYVIGKMFDLAAKVLGRPFTISSIRVKKFCANSVYNTAIGNSGFVPPVHLRRHSNILSVTNSLSPTMMTAFSIRSDII